MYAGKIVEVDEVKKLFKKPLHPYSQRLFNSIPTLGGQRVRMEGILGQAPDRLNWPNGCRFHPRCPMVMDVCSKVEPPLVEVEPGHLAACHLLYDVNTQQVNLESEQQSHGD
jgi:peptide/nickel transport system ATP-binding protein